MRLNGWTRLIGCSNALMCARPKFLQCEHSIHTWRQSVSIPGQKNRSRSLSLIRSAPRCPFCSCVLRAVWNPDDVGWHSVLDTRSDVLLLTRHSLSFSIMKPLDRCIARLRSAIESPADLPNKCRMMGVKKMSPWKRSSRGCVGAPSEADTCSMSFLIPFNASQSGNTDQEDLSVEVRGRFCHILLK